MGMIVTLGLARSALMKRTASVRLATEANPSATSSSTYSVVTVSSFCRFEKLTASA